MTFETLEQMVLFQDDNEAEYEITFGSDRAHLYKRDDMSRPIATVIDNRSGVVAMKLLQGVVQM